MHASTSLTVCVFFLSPKRSIKQNDSFKTCHKAREGCVVVFFDKATIAEALLLQINVCLASLLLVSISRGKEEQQSLQPEALTDTRGLLQNGSPLSGLFCIGVASFLLPAAPSLALNGQEKHQMFSWSASLPFPSLSPLPSPPATLCSSGSPLPKLNMYRFYGSLENKWLSFHRRARM